MSSKKDASGTVELSGVNSGNWYSGCEEECVDNTPMRVHAHRCRLSQISVTTCTVVSYSHQPGAVVFFEIEEKKKTERTINNNQIAKYFNAVIIPR